jgi:hypothetical protein
LAFTGFFGFAAFADFAGAFFGFADLTLAFVALAFDFFFDGVLRDGFFRAVVLRLWRSSGLQFRQ